MERPTCVVIAMVMVVAKPTPSRIRVLRLEGRRTRSPGGLNWPFVCKGFSGASRTALPQPPARPAPRLHNYRGRADFICPGPRRILAIESGHAFPRHEPLR